MIGIIVQARLNSERLKAKTLLPLNGISVLRQVIRRAKQSKLGSVVVALAHDSKSLIPEVEKENVPYLLSRRTDRNVLGEFYDIADTYDMDVVVRLTADCPCISARDIDRAIKSHMSHPQPITCVRHDNIEQSDVIDGLDIEVFDFYALQRAYEYVLCKYDKEHVTSWIYNNYPSNVIESGWMYELPIKLSIDTKDDYKRIKNLYEKFGDNVGIRDIVRR